MNIIGSGSDIGMKFSYKAQPSPDGIAQGFILGKDSVTDVDSTLKLFIFYPIT